MTSAELRLALPETESPRRFNDRTDSRSGSGLAVNKPAAQGEAPWHLLTL